MNALDIYNEIISTSIEDSHKRKAIKSMIRIHSRNNLNYNDVSELIINELNTAAGAYKASLDFILIDVDVRSAIREKDSDTRNSKIMDAVNAFAIKSEQYAGTSMEVEMLCRIATLYDDIGDRIKAREYADMAFNINSGQECVFDAYLAAGMETDYDPSNYTDIYKDVDENFDQPPISPKPAFAVNSIFSNPNPFNPLTTITYSIKNPSHVKLVIYSITGQKVATLVDKHMSVGSHSVIFDGSGFGSGVYLYKLKSKDFAKTGKILLMK